MSNVSVSGTATGNALQELMVAPDIQPGDDVSYQTCKTIYAYHPLGAKMVDVPIELAQSQPRDLIFGRGPEEALKKAFDQEWESTRADELIANAGRTARIYGVGTLALVSRGTPPDRPINFQTLADAEIGFNVLDPLNTAGSLVLQQDPNAADFQKIVSVSVAGEPYHRSRTVSLMNERPLYIEYTNSAFGYVGRSVYQRALYPLRSYLQSMITDDMVLRKAGVLVAKIKGPSSILDRAMNNQASLKRDMIKEAQTDNVLSIGPDDAIESMDLKNLEGPVTMSRKNVLDNIATAGGMPAKLLNSETFAEGFGEGTEDAKAIAKFIADVRKWLQPLYAFLDRVVIHRAWNPEFYKTIQKRFPQEYGNKTYRQAFQEWEEGFATSWPNLLEEPDSEKANVDKIKMEGVTAVVEVVAPMCDPDNRAKLLHWMAENFNELTTLFSRPLDLDWEAIAEYAEQQKEEAKEAAASSGSGEDGEGGEEPKPPKPFASPGG